MFFMLFLLISVIQLPALHFIYYIIPLYPSRGFGEHMPPKKIEKIIKTEGMPDIIVRLAKVPDMRRIQMLYAEVYGAAYPIPIIMDKDKMRHAIEDNDYYWLVAECQGRIIGSLVYALDLFYRNSKAFGAVVSQEYRKHNLAFMMMKLVLDDITVNKDLVDLVYATTRTANHAPQRLTESLGFIKLGIFPNTHKVHDKETHCLTAYLTEGALQRPLGKVGGKAVSLFVMHLVGVGEDAQLDEAEALGQALRGVVRRAGGGVDQVHQVFIDRDIVEDQLHHHEGQVMLPVFLAHHGAEGLGVPVEQVQRVDEAPDDPALAFRHQPVIVVILDGVPHLVLVHYYRDRISGAVHLGVKHLYAAHVRHFGQPDYDIRHALCFYYFFYLFRRHMFPEPS